MQMYYNVYRCKIKGGWQGKPGADPLPVPQLPKACAGRPEECTKGAKQMVVWGQAEGNNVVGDGRFNDDFGYADGAQADIWELDDKKPVAKVLRRDEGGDNQNNGGNDGKEWDQKWYKQTWTLDELRQPWTDEERVYIEREVHQHWDNILSEKDYNYLDMNSLSVPAQYVVRKLRAQLWLATASKEEMPQTKQPGAAETKAPEQKPTAAEAKVTEAVRTQAQGAEQPKKTAALEPKNVEGDKTKEEASKQSPEDQKKVEEELKKKAEEANKKAQEAKKNPEDQKKKEEEEQKKKDEEARKKADEDKKKEEEKKKADETSKRSEAAPTSYSWGFANLNEYLDKLRREGQGPAMAQIEYLKESWKEMQADDNYPPDMIKWWQTLQDKFEPWKTPTPVTTGNPSVNTVRLNSIIDAIKNAGKLKRGEPHPTPAPRLPAHPKREMNIDSDKVLVNTLQDVQTTKLLLFNPNAKQEAKTEGVYTKQADGPAPTPIATLRGPPANAKKPSPTTSSWEPTGTYASLFGYLLDEVKHDPSYRLSPAQLRWLDHLKKSRDDGIWNGEWTKDFWTFMIEMRHQQRKRWLKPNDQGDIELQDWDTRTYRDKNDVERFLRQLEWSDDEIRGFNEAEVIDYNALVARVQELGGWNSAGMKKSDRYLDEESHLRWPEIYVLRKLRFAKKKLRDSVKQYFDDHRW